jgi:hypothetical protein
MAQICGGTQEIMRKRAEVLGRNCFSKIVLSTFQPPPVVTGRHGMLKLRFESGKSLTAICDA